MANSDSESKIAVASPANLFDVRDQLELRLQAASQDFEVITLRAYRKLNKSWISFFFTEIEPTTNIVFQSTKKKNPSYAF